ncbi:MAG: insulinase family protein, partial [Planctomycetes bacterium]|nr:insulinase family protein [Planctomycetota bacterium]
TVLCGSARYPVKDPFVELLKTSLATFLNAFTYPDRTVYPCSSMNEKDFHNLMRVYCDAVFFPTLSEDHFRQEGHHLEFDGGRPAIKGVVYNEMRGVYSDPDGILDRHIQSTLFASNAYGRDYGGDPKAIPELTYQQFVAFHRAYYHPSNAWIFTYGNASPAVTWEILDREYLGKFDAGKLDTAIAPLERWHEPKKFTHRYPLDAGDSPVAKTDIAVAFATNDRRDAITTLAMKVIDGYLLDNAASPLRKALIDSRLGEELGGSGYADHQRDTYFIVDLKGSEPERAEAVEALVLDVVRRECEAGFDPEKVESVLHRLELAAREIRPQYPLRLLERVFASWLYDSDPLEQVDISGQIDQLRAAMAADVRFLENTAATWLVENRHRLRITLVPDPEYLERNDRQMDEAMDRRLAEMSPADRHNAEETARRLEAMQSAGNTPEALATLPRLAITDVSPTPMPLAYAVETVSGRDFVRVPLYAGGVGYCAVALQLSGLDEDDLTLLPLFCEALSKTGAAGLDYAAMAAREAAVTGALEFNAGLITHVDGPAHARCKLGIWLKALDSDWDQAMAVLSDRLFRADFGDRERLRDIILQSRMAWRNQIVPAGNVYAALYAAKELNSALALSERLSGCTQARFIDHVANTVDSVLPSLPDRLTALRHKILAGAVPCLAQIGADNNLDRSREWLAANADRFGGRNEPEHLTPLPTPAGPFRVGLAAPADVAFAARSLPAPAMSDPAAAALALLGVQLSYGYLWNEIRVKGGAYGARAAYDGARGSFTFSSFRDPNLFATLDAFAGAARFVAEEMDLSPAALEQSIIGTVKTLDVPMRPSTAVVTALNRHLGGDDESFRQRLRSRLLSLDADAVRTAAAQVFAGMPEAPVAALASREKITEENARNQERPLAIEPLWEN